MNKQYVWNKIISGIPIRTEAQFSCVLATYFGYNAGPTAAICHRPRAMGRSAISVHRFIMSRLTTYLIQ